MSGRIGLATGYDPAQSVRDFAQAVRQVRAREIMKAVIVPEAALPGGSLGTRTHER